MHRKITLTPYSNSNPSGTLRGTSEGIYKVKAVFVHRAFRAVSKPYTYSNTKTGETPQGTLEVDHMDVAVVFLDQCTTPTSGNKARHGKVAGANFAQLSQYWQKFDSKTNTEGLPGTYWGYGESEDDRVFPAYAIGGARAPKPVRRGNWNFNRATSGPSVATANQRKVWNNCDWLPDTTAVWNSASNTVDAAYTAATYTAALASPFIACTPRNPNDPTVNSLCRQKTSSSTCTASTSMTGSSYCKWSGGACEIDTNVVGGIGLVQYPSSGAGDSGSAMWYIENSNKLTLNDRDQLNLVHIGIVFAAAKLFPEWDQTIRTDYLQNWLANVIDRDSCAASATTTYFSGFATSLGGSATSPPATQSGWDLSAHYVGQVKGVSGAVPLSQLSKRATSGTWPGQTTGASSAERSGKLPGAMAAALLVAVLSSMVM